MPNKKLPSLPIGVFDSGVGGLTVVKALIHALPNEDVIYLGDTARTPYGSRSAETIKQYTKEDINFLQAQKVKLIICACNTASAVAINDLKSNSTIPLLGVIDPMISQVVKIARPNSQIAVIGTKATINSQAYDRWIKTKLPKIKITSIACPLLVPLIEEGWTTNPIVRDILKIYLQPLIKHPPQILILGCTHYPLIKTQIAKLLPQTTILDSGLVIAQTVKQILIDKKILNQQKKSGAIKFFTTDSPEQFNKVAQLFLKTKVSPEAKQVII